MSMNINPMQLIQMIKGGQNPQQLVMNMLEQQMQNTPMGANLLSLAKQNRSADIEQIARNICSQMVKILIKNLMPLSKCLGLNNIF